MDWAVIIFAALQAATPLLLAGLGELTTEKAGVLNLGVEGMMIIGAVVGFIVTFHSGNFFLGTLAAAAAAATAAAFFGVLTVYLKTNQVATGLALTIFGLGFSAFIGLDYEGKTLSTLKPLTIPVLADIPYLGKLLFQHDVFFYFALAMLAALYWFFAKTRSGLIVRAVGENHHAAVALGYRVNLIRWAAVIFGGAMCGVGGAYLSLVYTPLWAQNMTAGRGWVVLALVVFAAWRPLRLALGAFIFGFIGIWQLFSQANNISVPAQFLSMTPYLATIIALVFISLYARQQSTPQCLTQPLPIRL
ncbi:MAG: ABC transporter permease [Proteobacteria bacterium]|nr:ABC transporter permease [Pseudomonadota bacterium]MCH9757861.1 ABC transporter permease [Pseudomonadota bacterium]